MRAFSVNHRSRETGESIPPSDLGKPGEPWSAGPWDLSAAKGHVICDQLQLCLSHCISCLGLHRLGDTPPDSFIVEPLSRRLNSYQSIAYGWVSNHSTTHLSRMTVAGAVIRPSLHAAIPTKQDICTLIPELLVVEWSIHPSR